MKTREQFYRRDAEQLLRDITTYHCMKGEQIKRIHAKMGDKVEKILAYLVKQGRIFYDPETDMSFAQIDLVLNEKTYEHNISALGEIINDPLRGGFVSLMIHEQYFHSDYRRYLPDFEKRVLDACKMLKEKGYFGTHLKDLVAQE